MLNSSVFWARYASSFFEWLFKYPTLVSMITKQSVFSGMETLQIAVFYSIFKMHLICITEMFIGEMLSALKQRHAHCLRLSVRPEHFRNTVV